MPVVAGHGRARSHRRRRSGIGRPQARPHSRGPSWGEFDLLRLWQADPDSPTGPSVFGAMSGNLPSSVSTIATNGDAGVFWIVTGGGVSEGLVAHWDGAATTTLASFPWAPPTAPELTIDLAVSATQAFVLTSRALYSVPLSGGPSVVLRAWPPVSPMSYPQPQIVALNERSLFYSLDATSIVRRDLGSGDEHTIVGGLTLQSLLWGSGHIGWADASWLYFLTGYLGDTWTLSRAKVDGGEVEVLWDSTARPPSLAVAGDACSIYWLAASAPTPPGDDMMNGPSILMYRRK